jgi:CHAD domain-containing protein
MKKSNPSTSISRREPRVAAREVEAYFDTRSAAFWGALATAQAYYAVEGIHELRVETKRLRALFKLIEYTAPSFAAKPSASLLKPLFRAAGELRDIDICQALTLVWLNRLDLREYFNFLKKNELRLREPFAVASGAISKTALAKSGAQIRSALSATYGDRIRKRIEKKIVKLTGKLLAALDRKGHSNDDLHSVRKAAKALRYTLDIWQQCYGKTRAAETASAHLKKVYGHLGEWHDTLLTLESVETFLKHQPRKSIADPAAYATFRTELRGQAKKLLGAYDRGRQPLRQSLGRLDGHLSRRSTRPVVPA